MSNPHARTPGEGAEIGSLYMKEGERRSKLGNHYGAASSYRSAAPWFEAGAAVTIGHNRTARYQKAAQHCEKEAVKEMNLHRELDAYAHRNPAKKEG